jgi:hypothetical protein
MSETLYKVLNEDGSAIYADFTWPLPNGKPTKWVRAKGDLVLCENGIHLAREQDLPYWLGPAIFRAEARGERIDDENKIVVREARLIEKVETWNDRTGRLFACDCAARAMEQYGNADERSLNAIRVARDFVAGEATREDMAAAGASAWAAARAAAGAAEREWQAARLMEYLRGERT